MAYKIYCIQMQLALRDFVQDTVKFYSTLKELMYRCKLLPGQD